MPFRKNDVLEEVKTGRRGKVVTPAKDDEGLTVDRGGGPEPANPHDNAWVDPQTGRTQESGDGF